MGIAGVSGRNLAAAHSSAAPPRSGRRTLLWKAVRRDSDGPDCLRCLVLRSASRNAWVQIGSASATPQATATRGCRSGEPLTPRWQLAGGHKHIGAAVDTYVWQQAQVVSLTTQLHCHVPSN